MGGLAEGGGGRGDGAFSFEGDWVYRRICMGYDRTILMSRLAGLARVL